MNAINAAITKVFDLVLAPLEAVSEEFALLVVSGIFGVLALWIFKHISWQHGIKATKDKIKGHLIEIRLYQDDLGLVSKAIGKVLLRNLQYLFLNFAPFIPLAFPFAFVAAQMVVRYAFDPVPIQHEADFDRKGQGLTLDIEGDRAAIDGLEVVLPEGLRATEELVTMPRHGVATLHFVAVEAGVHEILVRTNGKDVTKQIVVESKGDVRAMQSGRVSSFFDSLLWPAEDTLAGTGLTTLRFHTEGDVESGYPESDLGWLPMSGMIGVLVMFVLASMVFGLIALKPLGVQI